MRIMACIAGITLAGTIGFPANAQLLNQKAIPASMAMTIAQVVIDTCKTNGYSVSVAVVGRSGELILQVRGDGTGPHTVENRFKKASAARSSLGPSSNLARRRKDDPLLPLIHLSNVVAAQG